MIVTIPGSIGRSNHNRRSGTARVNSAGWGHPASGRRSFVFRRARALTRRCYGNGTTAFRAPSGTFSLLHIILLFTYCRIIFDFIWILALGA